MKLTKAADGSLVSTPIYVGDAAAVTKMQACPLHEYKPDPVEHPGPHPGSIMTLENCIHCGANRSRMRGPPEFLQTLYDTMERSEVLQKLLPPVLEFTQHDQKDLPPSEVWFCWREYAFVEGCEEEGKRLLVPRADPHLYDQPFDGIWKTPQEAFAAKFEEAPDEDWILCLMILQPQEYQLAMVKLGNEENN